MPFEWTVLEPVRIRLDTSQAQHVAALLVAYPEATRRAMREVLERAGQRLREEVDDNLSGDLQAGRRRALNVRSGQLRGSWRGKMVDDLTYVAGSPIGYGALWERGFTAKPGIFPARAKAQPRKRGEGIRWVLDEETPWLPDGDPEKVGPGEWKLRARGKSGGGRLYPMVWLRTRGGPRPARPWAQPAAEKITPELDRDVARALTRVWTWLT